MEMLKNKNKWGALFLALVIVFLVWIIKCLYKRSIKKKENK